LASVDDEKHLAIWDIRRALNSPIYLKEAHKGEINCLDFSPLNEFLVATGSKDCSTAIWDLRNLSTHVKLLTYEQ